MTSELRSGKYEYTLYVSSCAGCFGNNIVNRWYVLSFEERIVLKKWYDKEYEWEIEVIGFNKDNEKTERFCRNGEEIGDKYTCTYGCPVNSQGQGICSKVMMMFYPIMEAVRSDGNLENIGGDSKYSKVVMCPDGCVLFRITAKPLGNKNFFKGKFFD